MFMSSTLPPKKRHRAKQATLSSAPPRAATVVPAKYFAWKAPLEWCVAALLMIPAIPMVLVLVVIVRLTSRGPGIYSQLRVGRHGRTFTMYKIRSMQSDAEVGTGAVWAEHADGRVTPVGRLLRKLHLDEFPQLINVLKGEMSLIGPRPERPEFTHHLARALPGYTNRLAVLPGITGLAQINLPGDTDLDCVRRKLILDLEYIAQARPSLDLRMFLCTAVRLMGIKGALAMRLFHLQRFVYLPREPVQPDNMEPLAASTADRETDNRATAAHKPAINGHSSRGAGRRRSSRKKAK